jgi:glyoxylase-like metal-dependent hydrolase (beta-lactamase superfamily II)
MSARPSLPDVPEITAEQLRAELEQGRVITVLDVRRTPEWAEWSIPGSVHVGGHDELWARSPNALARFTATPGTRVVAVCGRGNTSRLAAHELIARGIDAVSLEGGMRAWSLAWNSADVAGLTDGVVIVQVRRTGKGCLSYLVVADGEAAVIDPSVDPEVYVALARARNARITAVLETHVHADHLSRGRALASASHATLYLPEQDRVRFPVERLGDGATVRVGDVTITARRTPGHTFESTCYAVGSAVMTGDTLFLDSVGRPDLKSGTDQETRERARLLHASLQRLAALPGETIILPCHTSKPVAFDGRALSATLAQVRERTAELLGLGEAAFVEQVVARTPPPPPNHVEIVRLNEAGEFPDDPGALEAGANRCAIA